MSKYKVIVVDDSALMRIVISDIIDSTEDFGVVARFKNGKELIENLDEYDPDLITLDIEMPVMDGLTTLKELKLKYKKYPVIMLSSLTKQGSIQTIKCLELGAIDFVEKAGLTGKEAMKTDLINKISGILEQKNIIQTRVIHRQDNSTVINRKHKIDAVIIGASTGGPRALQQVLTQIDGDVGVPIFVVQHMPSGFTKAFAERLDKSCALKVVEASDMMPIEKNVIYIAPGGFHLTVGDGNKIKLNKEPAIWGVRPAVDILFESAVNIYKGNLLSVILTGMGKDGARGTELVKDSGGTTISEDQSTCTIYGMPKAAFLTGKVDLVLPLEQIGNKITNITKGR